MEQLHADLLVLLLAVLLSHLSWLPRTLAQSTQPTMKWIPANNNEALCNDFTRAGFFIHENPSSNNWVVFLESGGLCYSTESCNRRFFVREVREKFNDDTITEVIPYGSFDTFRTWNETVFNGRSDPENVISPHMTSMQCFGGVDKFFPGGMNYSIEGRDILDTDPTKNPLFHSYNHVLIPYCSSDVWLGEETTNTEAVRNGTLPCDCFNYTTSSNQNGCFNFNPRSSNLQFTFRGKIIYQSVIQQLLDDYGMMNAGKVVLAGSSAGGLGAINHAKWTREKLNSNKLMVLFDSAWFVDFQDGIETIFNGITANEMPTSSGYNTQRLLKALRSNSACNDTELLGYPCCFSSHCIMTQRNNVGDLQYYPEDTPTFALFSIYDLYLLVPGLARVTSLESVQQASNRPSNASAIVLDVLRVVGEYSGAMNNTLDLVTAQAPFLSYYVTQCFQHIYFATSTLWGADDESVFGSDTMEFTRGMSYFNHFISSGRWNTSHLAVNESGVPLTILDALASWVSINDSDSGPLRYLDVCQGVLCNDECPDKLLLGELTSNNWHLGVKILIAVLINGVALLCVVMKITFVLWLSRLEKKQNDYLESVDEELECTDSATHPFPFCDEKTAISVSCLDLYYAVTFKDTKAFKDEKKDKTAPVVLQNLDEEDSDSGSEEEQEIPSSRKPSNVSPTLRHLSTSSLPDHSKDNRKRLNRQKSINIESRLFTLARKPTSTDLTVGKRSKLKGQVSKTILKGVSLYFNPGKMVGIMGPSGCGKTTFLDLLTGRRKAGIIKGAIYVNGTPIDDIREWYIANTGYVLQLATPYYEELTVRENLTLAAQMTLSKSYTLRETFERVEQVMHVTGLSKQSELVVGGATGPGLSGGQKKRLVVALQLLSLPSIIFLDEPTSGLDATASFELLTHLNKLSDSNRTVIVTIHQPRLEIFHMFHQLVLLSDGKVAYHDVPDRAYEVFLSAVTTKYLEQGLVIPSLVEAHNPADVIMDMLGNPKMRQIITDNYQSSSEPMCVRKAIITARWKEYSSASMDSVRDILRHIACGAKHAGKKSSLFTRMAVLEARAAKRFQIGIVAFFPFMFFVFGLVMGTSYFQVHQALLVIAGMCVFSTASALFMFPAMYPYFQKALVVYGFEKADGVGRAYDLVIQGFIRFASITFFPVIFAVTTIYLLLVNHGSYDIWVYLQVVLVNIALNQTWIAILIALICGLPSIAFRLSQVLSATAGFSSGFFIPVGLLHWGYRWIVYINPNYYGLSSVAFFVLSEFNTDCLGNQLECYISSGPYILNQFFFDKTNPYLHLAILLGFTTFFLLLAIFVNWLRHTVILSRLKRIGVVFKKSNDVLSKQFHDHHDEYERHFSYHFQESEEERKPPTTLPVGNETTVTVNGRRKENEECTAILQEQMGPEEETGLGEVMISSPKNRVRGMWRSAANRTIRETIPESREGQPTNLPGVRTADSNQKRPSTSDFEEDNYHQVWRPKKQPRLAELVASLGNLHVQEKQKQTHGLLHPPVSPGISNASLRSRQQMLQDRIQVTQAVLTEEILSEERAKKPRISFKEASKRITLNLQKQHWEKKGCKSLSDVVSLYLAKKRAEEASKVTSPATSTSGRNTVPRSYQTHHGKAKLRRRRSTREGFDSGTLGAIPLEKWHKLVWESKTSFSPFEGGYKLETEL